MRPIERIDNFLKLVNWEKVLKRWNINGFAHYDLFTCDKCSGEGEISPDYDICEKCNGSGQLYAIFLKYWKENFDQRIGQVLINLDLIPDNFKIRVDEESDILIDQGISPEECLYWTSLYDENENLLDKPITRLIKDLEPNHIKRILKGHYKRLSENYRKAFDNILQAYCPGIIYDIQ